MPEILMGQNPQKHIEPLGKKRTFTTFIELLSLIDPIYCADEKLNMNLAGRLRNFVETIRTGCDPIFDEDDLVPFFMIHFFQIPVLLIKTFRANRPWKKIDFQIGKVIE